MRTRLVPVVLVPLLVLTGCSSAGSGRKAALGSTPTPTTSPSPRSGTAPVAGKAPTSHGTTGTTSTSSAAPVVAAPLSTTAPGQPAAQQATVPGTYLLDTSGTITYGSPGTPQDAKGTQTLTVSALKAGLQHSTLHGDQGDTDEELLVRDTGTYVASLKLTSPAFTKEFRPSPAALLVPDPATVGATWSWSGTSTDGKTTARASSKIARLETVTIGGRKVPCAVLLTHLVLSGDITYAADVTTWWSPDYRLPVKDHTVGKGQFGAFPFQTDISTLMRSVTPS